MGCLPGNQAPNGRWLLSCSLSLSCSLHRRQVPCHVLSCFLESSAWQEAAVSSWPSGAFPSPWKWAQKQFFLPRTFELNVALAGTLNGAGEKPWARVIQLHRAGSPDPAKSRKRRIDAFISSYCFLLSLLPSHPSPCIPTPLTYFRIIFQGTHGEEVGKGWRWDYGQEGGGRHFAHIHSSDSHWTPISRGDIITPSPIS